MTIIQETTQTTFLSITTRHHLHFLWVHSRQKLLFISVRQTNRHSKRYEQKDKIEITRFSNTLINLSRLDRYLFINNIQQ